MNRDGSRKRGDHRRQRWVAWPIRWVTVAGFAFLLGGFSTASAGVSINVNTTDDEDNNDGDCSLREAVKSANDDTAYDACPAGSGKDTINVPSGTYPITNGPLDVHTEMFIQGDGMSSTILDGGDTDQIMVRKFNNTANLYDLTFWRGYSNSEGGCLYQDSPASTFLTRVAFSDCTADGSGGAISFSGSLTLIESSLSHNTAVDQLSSFIRGGGVHMWDGSLNVQRSEFIHNTVVPDPSEPTTSYGPGGAIYQLAGTATIFDTDFTNNMGSTGGAIESRGDLHVTRSTFFLNTGQLQDGAINHGGGSLDNMYIINSTFSSNFGGAIGLGEDAWISNSTFVENDGYHLYHLSGTINVQNSIFESGSSPNCSGTFTSLGYNIDQDGTCGFSGPGDLTGVDPLLDTLKDNGGYTRTHAIDFNSPAYNAGNPAGCTNHLGALLTTDQRGFPRPKSGRCDIGAFEYAFPYEINLPLISR